MCLLIIFALNRISATEHHTQQSRLPAVLMFVNHLQPLLSDSLTYKQIVSDRDNGRSRDTLSNNSAGKWASIQLTDCHCCNAKQT